MAEGQTRKRNRDTVLVVDDEESVLRRLQYMLEDQGYSGKLLLLRLGSVALESCCMLEVVLEHGNSG